MNTPAICNGCGNESSAWDRLCETCSKEVTCQNCKKAYKRGQGLQEVDLCATCLHEMMESPEEERRRLDGVEFDPYEEYGFDHAWELYEH